MLFLTDTSPVWKPPRGASRRRGAGPADTPPGQGSHPRSSVGAAPSRQGWRRRALRRELGVGPLGIPQLQPVNGRVCLSPVTMEVNSGVTHLNTRKARDTCARCGPVRRAVPCPWGAPATCRHSLRDRAPGHVGRGGDPSLWCPSPAPTRPHTPLLFTGQERCRRSPHSCPCSRKTAPRE